MQNDDLKSTNDRMTKQRGQTRENYHRQCTVGLVQQILRQRLQRSNALTLATIVQYADNKNRIFKRPIAMAIRFYVTCIDYLNARTNEIKKLMYDGMTNKDYKQIYQKTDLSFFLKSYRGRKTPI